jgi:dimethylhistidine N-methyltransferase
MDTGATGGADAAGQPSNHSRDLAEIHEGMSLAQKKLSPKYFYDERGSQLFEAICELPEYYPTRTEIGIMRDFLPEMARSIGPHANVIEFGIGSGLKTKLLLDALDRPVAFIPVDISGEHLLETVEALKRDFPDLQMLPVATDFTRPFPVPETDAESRRNLVYFPGSTIGNFEPEAAIDLLRVMHREAGEGGCLLIGADLQKDIDVLERAYNDSQGITAEFNLNMLHRLNGEYGADFELDGFRHNAVYNTHDGRIEMHLVSQREQRFNIGEREYSLERDETICSEYSYKYTLPQFADMAAQAGFTVKKVWTDSKGWFSLQYCERA